MKRFLTFPNPVNDAAARCVALGVVAMSVTAFLTGWAWILIVLAYGFLARVAAGPRLSPLGRFAVAVAAPTLVRTRRFGHWQRFVPGPPKRFAQAIGATLSLAAVVIWLDGSWLDARWVLLPLCAAASLEGFMGYCLGCTIFGWLIRRGLVPHSVCLECADLTAHYARLSAQNS